MSGQPRVLISGGGIGGNAVALQLLRAGISTTVLERAERPRPGGQAVDLRGPSKEVAERMGLMPGIRRYQLDERGMKIVDQDGNDVVRMPAEMFDGKGGVAEIEITRGDLNQVLLDAIDAVDGPPIDYRYGEWITEINQDATGIDVTLRSGATERFDILIGADGLHSETRRLVFGPEERYSKHLGGYMSFFTMPTPKNVEPHWFSMNIVAGGTNIGMRPDADPATSKALITLRTDVDPALRRNPEAQRRLIRERLAEGGWLNAEILAAMASADDFYFDQLARISMPSWQQGRVALLGDAGYCGSPMTGQGTAMAIVGAYLLAGEIASRPENPEQALARYEQQLRPFVAKAQALPPGGLKAMAPKTRLGIRIGHAVNRMMTAKVLRPLIIKMMSGTDSYELPDYSTKTAAG